MRGLALVLILLAVVPVLADEPLHILLAGDSTMAPKAPHKRPETGWGEMLQAWFDERDVVVKNHARNGQSTRTFIEEGRWQVLADTIRPGDHVFIQFGHNDQSVRKAARYTPPSQYQANLRRFISEVRARDGVPVLLTPVVRRRFDETGAFYDSHGEYPGLARAVAQATETELIDMETSSRALVRELGETASKSLYLWLEPGDHANYPEGIQDNTHFSPEGAQTMAKLFAGDLRNSGLRLARLLREPPGE